MSSPFYQRVRFFLLISMINARLKTIRSKIYSRLMSSPNLVATFLVGWLNRLFGFKKLSKRLFFDFSSHCSRTFSRWSRKNARNVIKRTGIFLKNFITHDNNGWLSFYRSLVMLRFDSFMELLEVKKKKCSIEQWRSLKLIKLH